MDTSLVVAVVAGVLLPAGGGVWYLSGRLTSIEGKVTAVNDIVRRELNPNGGESLRDRVVRIETHLYADHLNRNWDDPDGTPI